MQRPIRRLFVLAVIPALLLLASCVRLNADFEILNEEDLKVSFEIGVQNQVLSEMGGDVDEFCDMEGLDEVDGLTAELYEDDGPEGFSGCRYTGVAKIADMNDESGSHLTLADGVWTFSMEGMDDADDEDLGEFGAAAMFSDFRISVKFPGEVLTHNGSSVVDGTTVTWTSAADLMSDEGLTATAKDTGGSGLPWLWIGVVLAAILVVLGLMVALFRSGAKARKSTAQPLQQQAAQSQPQWGGQQGHQQPWPGQSAPQQGPGAVPQQPGQPGHPGQPPNHGQPPWPPQPGQPGGQAPQGPPPTS